MVFNSLQYIVFFSIIFLCYYATPYRSRWMLVLAGSCYFYMAFVPVYILILGFTVIVDYCAALVIEKSQGHKRSLFLIVSLLANIGILLFFKYYNFLSNTISILFDGFGYNLDCPYYEHLLPLGLSFHTLQAMGYTIEVYRGNQKAERHFGFYALYVMFFPQLVAGPIERPQNLIHQFKENHDFDYDRVKSGLMLILWGLLKKVVIADRLAIVVNTVYNYPQYYSSFTLIIATIFFGFQIFCDFSGYSDIAIGSARILGIKLMKNFANPYQSRSISEFWRRWHISLSTWFRDYLYISLGGNRVPVSRWYLNLFIVFLISGLWHGANETFIIWGCLHGFYMVFGSATKNSRAAISKKLGLHQFPQLQIVATFLLVSFAWIFFRSNDLSTALYITGKIFFGFPMICFSIFHLNLSIDYIFGVSDFDLLLSLILIVFVMVVSYYQEKIGLSGFFKKRSLLVRWSIYYTAIIIIVCLGVYESTKPFIYFQF